MKHVKGYNYKRFHVAAPTERQEREQQLLEIVLTGFIQGLFRELLNNSAVCYAPLNVSRPMVRDC